MNYKLANMVRLASTDAPSAEAVAMLKVFAEGKKVSKGNLNVLIEAAEKAGFKIMLQDLKAKWGGDQDDPAIHEAIKKALMVVKNRRGFYIGHTSFELEHPEGGTFTDAQREERLNQVKSNFKSDATFKQTSEYVYGSAIYEDIVLIKTPEDQGAYHAYHEKEEYWSAYPRDTNIVIGIKGLKICTKKLLVENTLGKSKPLKIELKTSDDITSMSLLKISNYLAKNGIKDKAKMYLETDLAANSVARAMKESAPSLSEQGKGTCGACDKIFKLNRSAKTLASHGYEKGSFWGGIWGRYGVKITTDCPGAGHLPLESSSDTWKASVKRRKAYAESLSKKIESVKDYIKSGETYVVSDLDPRSRKKPKEYKTEKEKKDLMRALQDILLSVIEDIEVLEKKIQYWRPTP